MKCFLWDRPVFKHFTCIFFKFIQRSHEVDIFNVSILDKKAEVKSLSQGHKTSMQARLGGSYL